MTTMAVYEALKNAFANEEQLEQSLSKLLRFKLDEHHLRLRQYESELAEFEDRYGMASDVMNEKFEAGELGDAMDFFEWSGLFVLSQYLRRKIERLEKGQ
ncbi:MAG: hypothetical protein HY328_01190 [Chloroflexi bacterium]|nr:hypothetical protein [Chloroflexota bacterium]